MSKRKRYRPTDYPGLLDQWTRSGESAERFSAKLGVSVSTLLRWRKLTAETKPGTAVLGPTPAKGASSRSLFTPVQVVRAPRAETGLVEVVTRSGCVVRVHGAVDEETLASVFAAVSGC